MIFLADIIAQATPVPVPFDWERMLMFQGPLYVLFGVFIWFLIWYGPGMIQGHRDMMKAVSDSSRRTAESTETLSDTLAVAVSEIKATREAGDQVREDIHQMKQATKHAVSAGERLVQKTEPHDSDVVRELRKAKSALDNGE